MWLHNSICAMISAAEQFVALPLLLCSAEMVLSFSAPASAVLKREGSSFLSWKFLVSSFEMQLRTGLPGRLPTPRGSTLERIATGTHV